MKLTVYYDSQYWLGVFEKSVDGEVFFARHIFGAEPADQEVYDLILGQWGCLRFGSETVSDKSRAERRVNPKRMQRLAAKEVAAEGVVTKAQEAMKASYEVEKSIRVSQNRQEKLLEQQQRFEQKQAKKKEKQKGH